MIPTYARANHEHAQGSLRSGITYTQAPRPQPNLGRPFYDYTAPAPETWRQKRISLNSQPKYVLPSWMPEVWTKLANAPFDNTRSAMVRDNHDVKGELADWDKRLRTHIQSFNKDIRGGLTNVVAIPPLSSTH